jgi:hypothetical protein
VRYGTLYVIIFVGRESEDNAQWLRRQLRLAQNSKNKQVRVLVMFRRFRTVSQPDPHRTAEVRLVKYGKTSQMISRSRIIFLSRAGAALR